MSIYSTTVLGEVKLVFDNGEEKEMPVIINNIVNDRCSCTVIYSTKGEIISFKYFNVNGEGNRS